MKDLSIKKYGEQELFISGTIDKNSEVEMIEVGVTDAFSDANMWLTKREILRVAKHFEKLAKQIKQYEQEKEQDK